MADDRVRETSETPVLVFENVYKRSNKKLILRDINLTLSVGEVIAITGGNALHKSLLSRLICGQLTPDAGKIYRHGPPAPILGAPMGFNVGGSALRGLEFRAAAFGLDPHHYTHAIASLLPDPDVLQKPLADIGPAEKSIIFYASSYHLPCTHFVNNSAPIPAEKKARRLLRPMFREKRKEAGFIYFAKRMSVNNSIANQRTLRLHNGYLMQPEEVPTPAEKSTPEPTNDEAA